MAPFSGAGYHAKARTCTALGEPAQAISPIFRWTAELAFSIITKTIIIIMLIGMVM
jgi:hypothetical protein